jgi:hypothetical protein
MGLTLRKSIVSDWALCSGRLSLLLALFIYLPSCTRFLSEADIVGTYSLQVGNQMILLRMYPDNSYEEKIIFSPSKVEAIRGKWAWKQGDLTFDSFWVPIEFAPASIAEADRRAQPGSPRSTDPGGMQTFLTRRAGKLAISLFGDDFDVVLTKED